MSYTTTMRKDRDGWRAETRITLPDVQAHALTHRPEEKGETVLSLTTSKRTRGLSTFASVAFHAENGFTTHAMGMGTGLGDYGRTILQSGDRCTEKAIARLHAEALNLVPTVLEAVRAHYAAQKKERAHV